MGDYFEITQNKMADQTERAFQKQKNVFLNNKAALIAGPKAKKIRYVKNVGLGFKTPMEAKEGNYIDKKCPFTGVVQKLKMQKTLVIRRDYLHFIKKYKRFEKRHKNISAHVSPCFRDIAIGDVVTVGECRPLSKTVRFNVIKVTKSAAAKKQFKKF